MKLDQYSKEILFSSNRELARRSRNTGFIYVVLFSIIGISSRSNTDQIGIFVIINTLFIFLSLLRAHFAKKLTVNNLPTWKKYYYPSILSLSLLWGILTFYSIHQFGINTFTLLLMFSSGGLASGSSTSLGFSLFLLRTHLIFMLAPIIIALFMSSHEASLAMSIMVTFFLGVLYMQAKVTSNDFLEIIKNSIIIEKKNRELSIANKNALASSNAKSLFLANMSHEIRTPMNGILSCARFLTEKTTDKNNLSLLNTIQKCGDSLLIILNDILDFSKIESGKLDFESSPFNLHESINDIVGLLNNSASENGSSIRSIIDKDIPRFVVGDVTRFRQVLSNLVSNAIKFTSNSVEVHADLIRSKDEFYEIQFTVIDNGVGIPKELLPKLFQNFTQADSSTTRKFGGTGLGLSICKGIIDGLQGKIWVESEINKGSRFFFTLSFKKSNEVLTETNDNDLCKEDSKLAEKVPLTILIAEDNRINQLVLQKTLQGFGYQAIDIVSNGQEAVDIVQTKHYDLIFMDQHMPIMDGVEATRKIRKIIGSRIKIFAATASVLSEDRTKCINAGMDKFLAKPIKKDEIREALLSYQALISGNKKTS